MAKFTDNLNDPNTNFLRAQQGVTDNSAASAISGLGKGFLDYKKQEGLDNAKSDTQALQKDYLYGDETAGGGGGAGDPSVAVVTKYQEDGGDEQGVSALNTFSKKIKRLQTASEASNGADQYRQRAELLLKSQMNRMPGLSQEFKAIAGGILGTGSVNVKMQEQVHKEERADAKQKLAEFNADAKSVGLRPDEVLTKEGQIKYMRRTAERDKMFKLKSMFDMKTLTSKDDNFARDKKYNDTALEASYNKNLVSIRDDKADLQAGIVDETVMRKTALDAIPAMASQNRVSIKNTIQEFYTDTGGAGEGPSAEWFQSLEPNMKEALRGKLNALKRNQVVANNAMLFSAFGKEAERSRIEGVIYQDFDLAFGALDSVEGWQQMEAHRKTQDAISDEKMKKLMPRLQEAQDWVRITGTPYPTKLSEELILLARPVWKRIYATKGPNGEVRPPSTDGLQSQDISKLQTTTTFKDLTARAEAVMLGVQRGSTEEKGELALTIANQWEEMAKLFNPEVGVRMKKEALDGLVETLANGKNTPLFKELDKLNGQVKVQFHETLQRHSRQLLAHTWKNAETIINKAPSLKSKRGHKVEVLPEIKNGVFSFKVKTNLSTSETRLLERELQQSIGKPIKDLNNSMQAFRNLSFDSDTVLQKLIDNSPWKGVVDPVKKKVSKPVDSTLIDHVKKTEKFTEKAFWDHKQFTNGYGTKAKSKDEVITKEEAESRFNKRIQKDVDRVKKFVPDSTPDGVVNALASLTFNSGTKWMRSGLGTAVKAGDWDKAKEIFVKYNKAGGKTQGGLVKRRETEVAWFN